MKIIHVIPSFIGGGAERFVVSLCNEMTKNKTLDIHIIALYNVEPHMFLHKKLDSNIKVHTLSKKLGLDFKVFFKLYKLINKLKPQIVHTHLTAYNYNYLNLLLNYKPKYYHTLHADAILECPNPKNRKLRRLFYKRKVQAITISEISSDSFKAHYNLQNDKLIYNGREAISKTKNFNAVKEEIQNYRLTNNTKIILSIANLVPAKGHINLVKAFKNLINNNHDALLLLIGDRRPGDTDIYETIAAHQNERIKYLGVKQNIEDYLLTADAFCMSSNTEGMPITLIEAMAAQCIPIATPVGGIPNMITHMQNGLLAKDYTENAIFDLLKQFLLLNPEIKNKFKQKLLSDYQNYFSIENTTKHYLNLYKH